MPHTMCVVPSRGIAIDLIAIQAVATATGQTALKVLEDIWHVFLFNSRGTWRRYMKESIALLLKRISNLKYDMAVHSFRPPCRPPEICPEMAGARVAQACPSRNLQSDTTADAHR